MAPEVVTVKGKRFVMVPETEWRKVQRLAAGAKTSSAALPKLPAPDRSGNYPALEYIRASIARDVVRERRALGLTQQALAELAGVRQETVSRLESGKHSPTVRTVEKIERALGRAATRQRGKQAQ